MKVIKIKLSTVTANALTQHTLRVLALNGYFAWRNNNGAVYGPTKKVFRQNSTMKGIPDILGYRKSDGKFICCEIKAGKDKLSIEQVRFLEDVQGCNGFAFVIRSINDIENIFKPITK